MPHYICTGGCRGVSDTPGVCQSEECSFQGHQLEDCNCIDGEHWGAFEGIKEEEEEKK